MKALGQACLGELRFFTSWAAAAPKAVCLLGAPEGLKGFAVTSWGCFTSSVASISFMGTMLKA